MSESTRTSSFSGAMDAGNVAFDPPPERRGRGEVAGFCGGEWVALGRTAGAVIEEAGRGLDVSFGALVSRFWTDVSSDMVFSVVCRGRARISLAKG